MSRARGLFVTGTDTDVGKTVVTAALGHVCRNAGRTVGVLKPVQSGHASDDPAGDTMRLRAWLGSGVEPDVVNVYAFEEPLAPLVAARRTGRSVELGEIVDRAELLAARSDVLLVEGAGGLLVPMGEAWTIADLALTLGLPLVIVARASLGTVNHTLLTVRAARSLGLRVAAVVLNSATPGPGGGAEPADLSIESNAELIEEFGDVPALGPLPWLGESFGEDAIRAEHTPRLQPMLELAETAR